MAAWYMTFVYITFDSLEIVLLTNFLSTAIVAIISTALAQVPSENENEVSDLKIFRGPRHDEFDWALTKVSDID